MLKDATMRNFSGNKYHMTCMKKKRFNLHEDIRRHSVQIVSTLKWRIFLYVLHSLYAA